MRVPLPIAVAAVAALLAVPATPAAGPVLAQSAATPPAAAAPPMDAAAVVRRVVPAVVTVVNEQVAASAADLGGDAATPVAGAAGGDIAAPLPTGVGSGFFVDDQGHVVTNQHVVDGGDTFEVILDNGEARPATLVGADPLSDLAVLKVDGAVPAALAFGDSGALAVGESVLAVGSSLGDFGGTVTEGIVGALGRDLPSVPGNAPYSNMIQHDAAINPGNSGGPLVDASGAVVGVNTLGINEAPGAGPVQGLFFAIPASSARRVVASLIADGRVRYPYIGASLREVSPGLGIAGTKPGDYGAKIVAVVPNGPAANAGIQPGDVLIGVGDVQMDRQTGFTEALFAHRPGEVVTITLLRDGQQQTVDVTLGERPPGV